MLFSNRLEMNWPIAPCEIQSDCIVRGGDITQHYNPFNHFTSDRKLYLEFVNIDETKLEDILRFISQYGFLGLQLKPTLINKASEDFELKLLIDQKDSEQEEQLITYINSMKNFISHRRDISSERINDIQKEILAIRCIVSLWSAIEHSDYELLTKWLDYALENYFWYDQARIKFEGDENKGKQMAASSIIISLMNMVLEDAKPMLIIETENQADISIKGSWNASSLLTAMYIMLYTDIIQSKTIRKCRNETCNDFFPVYGNDKRKIYCNEFCTRAQVQREYRRRKKSIKAT